MMLSKTNISVSDEKDLLHKMHKHLGSIGLWYNLANGDIDEPELLSNVADKLPLQSEYPCRVDIDYVYDVDVYVYVSFSTQRNEPIVTGEGITKLAIACGFTNEEIETDERIINYGRELAALDNEYKVSNRFAYCSLDTDEYYEFKNNIHKSCMEIMPHIDYYDTIKCDGSNNLTIMYGDEFNSASMNWGTGYGMSLHMSDGMLCELRDKLIARFPFKDA